MIKRRCSSRNGKRWEAAPAAVLLSMRERKTTIAATKNVFLPCGKMTVSLKNEKRTEDLIQQFRGYLALDVLLAFMNERSIQALGV